MRRYELMLVIRPDAPDDRVQALLEKVTRQIAGAGARSSRQPRGAVAAWRIRSTGTARPRTTSSTSTHPRTPSRTWSARS